MNVFASNSREQRRLEGQLKTLSSSTKYEMNKIDQEIMLLKKQLVENQKIFGTRCDLRRTNNGGSRKSHITITKVITTSGKPDRTGPFPGRSNRRHSIASPIDMKESDYYNYDNKEFDASQKDSFCIGKYLNSPRSGPSTLPFSAANERSRNQSFGSREAKATTPRAGYRSQRRNSITSTEGGIESSLQSSNTPRTYSKLAFFSNGDNVLQKPGMAEKSASNFSFHNNKNRKQSSQLSNENKQSSAQFSATARRNVSRKPTFTLVFNEDEANEDSNGRTQRSARGNENLTRNFKDASSPDSQKRRLFQRRHSLPCNALLPPKPNEHFPLFRSSSREKLTAKLPARISSARTRLNTTPKATRQKLPTPVPENREDDDVFEKEAKDDGDDDDDDDSDDDEEGEENENEDNCKGQEEVCSDDDQPPQELRDLPKITLEEKIQKFFADSVDSFPETPGHFQTVLDQFNNNTTDNNVETKQTNTNSLQA